MAHKITLFWGKFNKCNAIDCWPHSKAFFIYTAEEGHISKEDANNVLFRCRISALGIVGDLLRKVGALELKLVSFDPEFITCFSYYLVGYFGTIYLLGVLSKYSEGEWEGKWGEDRFQ